MPPDEARLYVRFIDGTDVRIPVACRRLGSDLFEILPREEFDYEDDSVIFEFGPGDTVEADRNQLATRLVSANACNLCKRMFFAIVSARPSFQELIAQFGEESVSALQTEVGKTRWVYPAVSQWISANFSAKESV